MSATKIRTKEAKDDSLVEICKEQVEPNTSLLLRELI